MFIRQAFFCPDELKSKLGIKTGSLFQFFLKAE